MERIRTYYVFTPGTSLHFEIPHGLAPIALKTAVNIKEMKEMSELNFPYFCELSYFLSFFVIMMILPNS